MMKLIGSIGQKHNDMHCHQKREISSHLYAGSKRH